MSDNRSGRGKTFDVLTPLGRGQVVHEFRDGTVAVQLEHGGGHIFFPEDLQKLGSSSVVTSGANVPTLAA